ncbi:hypothetical protein ACFL6G_06535 [candidate division KSB1 bacterium]
MEKKLIFAVILIVFSLSGCTFDMDLRNDNDPDTKRVLVTPEDVEGLISSAFREYWFAVNGYYPGNGLSVIGDEMACHWGNWAIRNLIWEPRKEWNNSPSYGYRSFNEDPWYNNYHVISNVNDALYWILEGNEFGTPGSMDTKRAEVFGKFCRALSLGYIGLFFDRGVIISEKIDLQHYDPVFVEYDKLVDTSIEQLEECISICRNHSFTLPSTWINGLTITNEDLIKLCHSFIARYMVLGSRNTAERASVDWNSVLDYIALGITEDFAPEGDNEDWWHPLQYCSCWNGWFTASNRLIGPSDMSGRYSEWLNTYVNDRYPTPIESPDRRITGDITGLTDGKWFSYMPRFHTTPHYDTYNSRYRPRKFDYQYPEAYGPMPHLTLTEMDMLKAEAYLRGIDGTKADAAGLINKTRVLNGEMEPLTGDESDLELWKWMCYEKRMETQMTGIAFFDYRGWAGLMIDGEKVVHMPEGTPVHFPVPGKELEILMEDNYSFGGAGQPYTTPSIYGAGNVIDIEYIKKARERIDRHNKSKHAIPVRR